MRMLIISFFTYITPTLAAFHKVMFIPSKTNKYVNVTDDCIRIKATSYSVCFGTTIYSKRYANICPGIKHHNKTSNSPLKCQNGGHFATNANTTCTCTGSFTGDHCERYWKDCPEGYTLGNRREGIYTIKPRSSKDAFEVYCKVTKPGRNVIQKQTKGINFYRSWQEYKNGFGNLIDDHWLGLEKIRAIINSYKRAVLGIIVGYRETRMFTFYHGFTVGSEANGYQMNFNELKKKKKHNLFDCLRKLNGTKFSTFDNDNDDNPDGNCAKVHHSGWWFKNCSTCNPNGRLMNNMNCNTFDQTSAYWQKKPRCFKRIVMFLKPCNEC